MRTDGNNGTCDFCKSQFPKYVSAFDERCRCDVNESTPAPEVERVGEYEDKGPFVMSRYLKREDLYEAMRKRIESLEKEVERLREFEWMYKDLCK